MKITPKLIRNQQTSNPELISVGVPTLTILSPKLRVDYGVWTSRENDEKACHYNQ
jgi:hypothetical protein